jgi:hypothetical protein
MMGNYADSILLIFNRWSCEKVARKCRYLGVVSPHRVFHVAGMGVSFGNQFLRMDDYYSSETKGVCIINEYCKLTDTSYHQTPRHLEEYYIHFV